jgi:hypothetical protein
MAQIILMYHWLAHGDYSGYKTVNRPQLRQVVAHVFNFEPIRVEGFDFFMVIGLSLGSVNQAQLTGWFDYLVKYIFVVK